MSTAFILQNSPALDFSPVDSYAQATVYCIPEGNVSLWPEGDVYKELTRVLRPFNNTKDYLVLSGDPELIGIAVQILSIRFKIVTLLKYDRFTRSYHTRIHKLLT